MATKKETLKELYKQHNLEREDIFKHDHYTIITRAGIDKIQASSNISVQFEVVNCEPSYCVVKAIAESGGTTVETFGSALKGKSYKDGNCNTWYVMEMAEKRAMSRAVLKLTGYYQLGVFGEDESESFKKSTSPSKQNSSKVVRMKEQIDTAYTNNDIVLADKVWEEAEDNNLIQVQDYYIQMLGARS